MSTITWLHLSDLHIRADERYNQDNVLRTLPSDVQQRVLSDNLQPDFIVVSGDIAFSGQIGEYDMARLFFDDLLKATRLSKDRLFVVPGNHDVNRQAISRTSAIIAGSLDSQQAIDEILTSDQDRRLVLRKFDHYADFVNSYFQGSLPFGDQNYFYVHHLDLANRRVALLGLNSAWLSFDDSVYGQLALGEKQVRMALEESQHADLRIALLHHPLDWLKEFDRFDSGELLVNECHFILHGHAHHTGVLQMKIPNNRALVIAAGNCYKTRQYPNGYNIVQLDLQAGQGTVYLRAYYDKGGGFWTKDILTYMGTSDGKIAFSLPLPSPASGSTKTDIDEDMVQATQYYLRYLDDRYRYIDFKGMGVFDRVPLRLDLLNLYVPLKARVELPRGETLRRYPFRPRHIKPAEEPESLSETVSLTDLFQQHSGLIILGDPGAGKTTFLKYLALKIITQSDPEPSLPVLIPLSAYAKSLVMHDVRLDDFIAEYFYSLGIKIPMRDTLRRALDMGNAVIMLDGLDEINDLALRHTVVERVVDFFMIHQLAGNKFLLTSRIAGYNEARPIAEGLIECTLVDFGEEEIESFVTRWTIAIEKIAHGDTAVAEQEAIRERVELLDAIRCNRGVRQLASNPLLLTILALMKRNGVRLPERRVELYEQYTKTLLSSWNLARSLGLPPTRVIDPIETLRVLAPLALWIHKVSPTSGLVTYGDLLQQLVALFDELGETDPERTAQRFLFDVREQIGILVERGHNLYGFIHKVFEEYLAAVALAQNAQRGVEPLVEALAHHVSDPAWHEVILLTISYLGIIQQREKATEAVVEAWLTDTYGKPGETVVLAGDVIADIWPVGITAHAKEQTINALLASMSDDNRVEPHLRVRAGAVLARLGDQRQGVGMGADGLPDIVWCDVPAGSFLMGSNKNQDPGTTDDELPQHKMVLPAYRISKYPITNIQFAAFIEARGYEERQYWSEAGWIWKEQEGITEPLDWGEPWNLPNHPVVVNWHEAVAYCRWLSYLFKEHNILDPKWEIRLPSEAEWEKAVRGTDGRIYPWGNDAEPNRTNYDETGIGATSAVGCFPGGASPYGVEDMSGNVWEWCWTKWQDSYMDYRDDNRQEGGDPRVLRGGAYSSVGQSVRCACRSGNDPRLRSSNVGFRLVAVIQEASGSDHKKK